MRSLILTHTCAGMPCAGVGVAR